MLAHGVNPRGAAGIAAYLTSVVLLVLAGMLAWPDAAGSASAQQPGTGTLVVAKECLNAGPSPSVQFSLQLSRGTSTTQQYVPEEVIEDFTIGCGESKTFEGLEADTYNVLETKTAEGGFGQIANFCINVEVAAGETVECNLTNERFTTMQPPSTGDGGLVGSSPRAPLGAFAGLLLTAIGLIAVGLRSRSESRS